ncbi:MAG: PorT family protein [Tannerellaceae bacterium]|nr:PorT family protein [Tannerellaceae bacterium]
MRRLVVSLYLLSLLAGSAMAQVEKVKNQPYADMKLFHLGFHVGLHTQDLILTNTGAATAGGQTWFAEIPIYSPGFTVGIIGDMFMNPYFNLRFIPSIHFGDKKIVFREYESKEEYTATVRSNYLTFPLEVKYSSFRLNNYRPYLTAGIYGALDLGRKKGESILLKGMDYGITLGVGCDIYLPYFKLCPELKLHFGLRDLLVTDRADLTQPELSIYTDALSKATSRLIILTFNFE